MSKQTAKSLLLVKPKYVSLNFEGGKLLKGVLSEFEALVSKLSELGIEVIKVDADPLRKTATALFSSEWISTHESGEVVVYPLRTKMQQKDRNENVLEALEEKGFLINEIIDFTDAEKDGVFLEGTCSSVLDRLNKIAFASISTNTDEELFIEFCEDLEFTPVVFTAKTKQGDDILHTNSLLSISDDFVLFASAMVPDKKERKLILNQLKEKGREIIFMSEVQVESFLGSAIQLKNKNGEKVILMSISAYSSLKPEQEDKLKKYGELVTLDLKNIQGHFGKSLNSILLEVFLPVK